MPIPKSMKRLFLWTLILMATVFASMAQTQAGYVKTKGRLGSNGQVVAGTRLPGATVQVKGRNAVVTGANGVFSLSIPSNKYYLQTVRKNGYMLIDPEVLQKLYSYSSNPLILVMESPEQQKDDKLAAEKKLRRSLQKQLQAKEDALEELKEQNKVTQDEYRKALEALYEEQDKNGQLISEMAEQYALVDYDLLDAFNQQVSECILNGELLKADSLLRSKGNVDTRIARVHEQEAAQAAEQAELSRRQRNLEQSIAGTQAEKADIAQDCYSFFKKFIIECQHDSAAQYIEKRANLDPQNALWQFDAGSYFQRCGLLYKAEDYYQRALSLARSNAQADPQNNEGSLARMLNNVALLYQEQGRRAEADRLFNESLEISKRLAVDNPEAYDLRVASTLNNLGILDNRLDKSEAFFTEALDLYSKYAQDDPATYLSLVADVMNNLGVLYDENQYAGDSEEMYLNALGIYRQLAKESPDTYNPDVAATLNNLSTLYHRYGVKAEEGKQMQQEALQIYRQLAQKEPQVYTSKLATALSNLAVQYYGDERNDDGERAYDEALNAYRYLVQEDAHGYKTQLATKLYEQGIRMYQEDKFDKSEAMFTEALGIYRELADAAPQTYLPEVAKMLRNVANLLDKRKSWSESEKMYLEELTINQQLAQQSSQYNADVARTYGNLSNHALLMKQFDKALEYAHQGLACDGSKLFIHANIAAAHLFKGDYDQAEAIYRQYRQQLRDTFLDDLEQFGKQGVIPQERAGDVERIRQLLQQ